MNIPVYIIAFNNPGYVSMMVSQLQKLDVKEILVIDNGSTNISMQEYYKAHKNEFKLISVDKNHEQIVSHFYNNFPDVFAVTTPDIKFNSNLPKDFLIQLYNLSIRYGAYKVGLSLDISDSHLFNSAIRDTVIKFESKHWRSKIDDEKYELYVTEIDTSFAVYNKDFKDLTNLRVGKDFVSKYLPWYATSNSNL